MRTIPILFTFDQKLLMPAAVCITSLLENADKNTFYDIFIIHKKGCDFSNLNRLYERYSQFNITFRCIGDEFDHTFEIRGIPHTAYYRLLAPELIPEYGKILYSDVDVIFREDLSSYYDIPLGDNYFGAVDNCSALRPYVQKYVHDELGLDYKRGYYYSGNLIINSEQILRDHMISVFKELSQNDYLQQDMDIINIACNGRFLSIGPSFCLTNNLYELIVNRRDEMETIYGSEELEHALHSGIVHYNGAKPWKEACLNMDIWWDYYRRSVCFDEQFCMNFWHNQAFKLEMMPLSKRLKLVGRYFRKGGKLS